MTRAKTGWGGKRTGAGRKKSSQTQKTVVIRIHEALLPAVEELKARFKLGFEDGCLFSVTDNQVKIEKPITLTISEVNLEIEQLKQENNALKNKVQQLQDQLAENNVRTRRFVMERDVAEEKMRRAEGQLEALKSNYRSLKLCYEDLQYREYDCMAITSNGKRCSKKAVVDTFRDGLLFHVCLQHAKKIDKERNSL